MSAVLSADGLFKMRLIIGGIALREFSHHHGLFVLAYPGERFATKLGNFSRRRVIAVVSMNQLCLVEGLELDTAGLGYILEPGMEIEVDSWQFEPNQVAPLQFGVIPEQFVGRMDRLTTANQIKAHFFFELRSPKYSNNIWQQLGYATQRRPQTRWAGQDQELLVREQFARESLPAATLILRYVSEKPTD